MIGPRSTTLMQPMSLSDIVPGVLGDQWGHTILLSNRDRVACVSSKRVAYIGGEVYREIQVISKRTTKAPPFEDRVAKVSGLPPRVAKLPDEEKC